MDLSFLTQQVNFTLFSTNLLAFANLFTGLFGLLLYHLKPFIKSQDRLEQDIELLLCKFKEKVCVEYIRILEKAVLKASLDESNLSSLRGSPPHKPDLVGNYTNIFFNSIERTFQLKSLLKTIKFTYNFLLFLVVTPFIIFFISLVFKNIIDFKKVIEVAIYLLFFGQIASLLFIRYLGGRVNFFKEKVLEYS